ncbi:dihydrodipicolinate synthase family protein [Musicola keenii]|uniref:dihydrodipicolinate synthase family protein n=1 Tax=Musicola keenii TaxID=2884250 RepID=UPI0017825833|nr:dihydrodipicolinate synthase family protein [Musicola keenii]
MMSFYGLSAFPLTPADEQGRVDTDAFAMLLRRLVDAGVDSIGVLGSTGIYAYLSREERRRAVETAVDVTQGAAPIVVGIGALRTDEAITLAQDAADAGANGLLLAPVSYTPLTDEEVFRHFAAVARATPLPLCIYHNPSTTRFIFSHDLIARLADEPSIVALKQPGGDAVSDDLSLLRSRLPPRFSIGFSGDWYAADALLAGADSWYSVAAGLFPHQARKLLQAAREGNAHEAARINAAFEPLWQLFRQQGSLRWMYAAAHHLGLIDSLPPLPLLPPSQQELPALVFALERLQAI